MDKRGHLTIGRRTEEAPSLIRNQESAAKIARRPGVSTPTAVVRASLVVVSPSEI